jgi:putative membrane protein
MRISLALHVVALILWIGSLLILTRCMKIFTKSYSKEAEEGISGFRSTMKRMFYGFCLPGAVIALITGLYQFSERGAEYYMKLGWFHAKLSLVVVLFIMTFLAANEIKKIGNLKVISSKKTIALHAITSACMIAIIFLTILNR